MEYQKLTKVSKNLQQNGLEGTNENDKEPPKKRYKKDIKLLLILVLI